MAEADSFIHQLSTYANAQLVKAQSHEATAAKLKESLPGIPKKNVGPGVTAEKIAELVANVQSQIDDQAALAEACRGRAKSASAGFFRALPEDRKTFTADDHTLYSQALARGVVQTSARSPAKKK
jgi:hypothetical protein